MSGRGCSILIVLALALLVAACSDGHRADLSQIPDPFPTDIDDIDVQAVSNADFDVNGDGVIGRCDLDTLKRSYGSDRLERDLDGDGVVGPEDALAWVTANRDVLPPQLTDEGIVDGIRWFTGNQLVVYFDAEALANSEDRLAYKEVFAKHGLVELGAEIVSLHPFALVETPDRDLPRHIQALASEPLVASINLNSFTTIMCIEPQESQ